MPKDEIETFSEWWQQEEAKHWKNLGLGHSLHSTEQNQQSYKSTRLVKRLVQYDGECQTELIAPKSQTSNLASYVEQHKVQFLSDTIRAVNW